MEGAQQGGSPLAQIDFERLAGELLGQARELLPRWFPAGEWRGREFVVGNLQGDPGGSLSINADTGRWADFADDAKGGDLISLYAAMRGLTQAEAARELSADATGGAMPARRRSRPQARKEEPAEPIEPVPDGAPAAPMLRTGYEHPKFGPPTGWWEYLSGDGELLGYIVRFDPPPDPDGKPVRKQFIPQTWRGGEDGRWSFKSWPKPRPLYGLDHLAAKPDKPVMLVEGEKAADAAREIAGRAYVVVSWPGGSKAIDYIDFTPLHGRKLLLWPDADAAGVDAMRKLAERMVKHCHEVKLLDTTGEGDGIDAQPDGWDAADALEAGWDWADLKVWAKPRAKLHAASRPAPPEPVNQPAADDPDDEQAELVTNHFRLWSELGLHTTQNGTPQPVFANAVRVLRHHKPLKGVVWLDEFHGKMLTRRGVKDGEYPRQWNDSDDRAMLLVMQEELGILRMGLETVRQAVKQVAEMDRRNEVTEWMNTLEWDGTDRLHQLLARGFGAEDNEYTQAVGTCWMISMVARAMEPGCKVDTMPVFEGGQGIGKSTALRVLVGRRWFAECNEPITSKDFYGVLEGHLLAEIGELDSFKRAEVERVKAILSTAVDTYRKPYQHHPEAYKRTTVLAGTTNRSDWNKDETGARRFWPVACNYIDLAWLGEHREQLFAEAVVRYQKGQPWWDVPVDAALAEQESRRQHDTWEDIIDKWLRENRALFSYVTTEQVLADAIKLQPGQQDRTSQMRCGIVMRVLGWRKDRQVINGKRCYVWLPPEREDEEPESADGDEVELEGAPF